MVPPSSDDGPTLQTYVETRFNLLTESLKDLAASQAGALGSAIEALKAALAAADLRYEQRFEAQGIALTAAMQAAKEAVQAAQAAADRAVAKAESAADKRFESLNELRQMVNDVVGTMMPKAEAHSRFESVSEKLEAMTKRIDEANNRLNILSGRDDGNRRTKDDTRNYVAVGLTVIAVLIGIATFIIARMSS